MYRNMNNDRIRNILNEIGVHKELDENERRLMLDRAEEAYGRFMDVILPDWQDDPNSIDTPRRVAKMYVDQHLEGMNRPMPKMTDFDNSDVYDGIVFQGNIEVKSICSHHHMPFFGRAHVAYIPSHKTRIIGLSKLNRLTRFFSKRAQVQENLTMQIHRAIDEIIGNNKGVGVVIEAQHTCVSHRGAENESIMKTAKLSGLFWTNEIGTRREFYSMIENLK